MEKVNRNLLQRRENMLSHFTNNYIITEKGFSNLGEILFIQKMKELLYNNSGVSYSYKIHNLYSILLELESVIDDYYFKRTNGYILEEVRKEAVDIMKNDLVLSRKKGPLYDTIRDELKKSFSVDKNNQSINSDDLEKVDSIYNAIKNLQKVYSIMNYITDTLDMLKSAIQGNTGEEIISLTECLVSSIIITKRTIPSCYSSFVHFFESTGKSFDDCWKQWVSSLLLTSAKYRCFFEIGEKYKDKVLNCMSTEEIRNEFPNANNLENVIDDSYFYYTDIEVPANDQYAIIEKAFKAYKEEMGLVEFATAKVKMLEEKVVVYDKHFNRFMKLEKKDFLSNAEYKPYNQYHKNIDRVVRKFTGELLSDVDRNKLNNAVINTCNFEKEGKAYSFLLLWSSLEALFRSTQYPTAISAIKDIVPNILSHRYIYYRLYDFLKDCNNIGLQYQYLGKSLIVEVPSDEQIELLFILLRDTVECPVFLQKCRDSYELLYYRGIELRNILKNGISIKQKIERHRQILGYQLQRMYRIRNRFVHHSMVDENIDVLCKHIRVYMWEAIREMSYVAVKRQISTLEELYAYFRMNHTMMQKTLTNANSPTNIEHILNGYL